MSPVPCFKIAPGIQSYDWGKKGSTSLAAQLGTECVHDFEIDENKTYAELWMGTHPTLPSKVSPTTLLSEHLKSHPEFIGTSVTLKFPEARTGQLPFLFKVLSIGTALSIQAHPDKPLAKKLFDERPNIYKDPNHKPEMAIALTPFKAFLNFLPLPALLLHLLTVPELSIIVPEAVTNELAASLELPTTRPPKASLFVPTSDELPSENQKAALKKVFDALMSASDDKVSQSISALIARYKSGKKIAASEKDLVDLTIMLNEQYPGDVGVLCVFVLNVVELKRGEAAFLGANVPHAYISGDIIECMAQSDNVVRAGLTPKLRDVPTLVDMLTYEAGAGSKQLLTPVEFNRDPTTLLYDPPIEEFSVLRVEIAKDEVTTHRPIDGPSVVVITEGEAIISWGYEQDLIVCRGDVVFLAAGYEYQYQCRKDFEAYRAFVEA